MRNASLQLDTDDAAVGTDSCRAFSPNRLSRHRRVQLSQRGNLCDESNSGRWSSRSRLSSCSSTADEDSRQIAIGVLFRQISFFVDDWTKDRERWESEYEE
ncbi:unnamed protein product [Gongylonema pulchrum]|uniref:Uncharacterized protein n=1 Tax=Gongylonema pulchrum TaxID=637853 RepID=A0A183EZI4_9BILA|nr:unnamed protein product [Gongylonema pulchrum]